MNEYVTIKDVDEEIRILESALQQTEPNLYVQKITGAIDPALEAQVEKLQKRYNEVLAEKDKD